MKNDNLYRRGDIYLADLSPVCGSEQDGVRPVLVLQNNESSRCSTTVIVAALTGRTGKRGGLPTHYLLREAAFLSMDSLVLLEQIRTIDKRRVIRYLGSVGGRDMEGVNRVLSFSIGL